MKQIVFCQIKFRGTGGVSFAGEVFLNSLLNTRYKIHVLSYSSCIYINKDDNLNWVMIKRNLDLRTFKIKNILKTIIFAFTNPRKFDPNKVISSINPDVIIFNGVQPYLIKKTPTQKSILILHGEPSQFQMDNSIEKTIYAINQVDGVVFLSKILMQKWSLFNEIKTKKSYVIENSLDEKRLNHVRNMNVSSLMKEIKFQKNDINVVIIGSVSYRKGQDILIDLYPKLKLAEKKMKFFFVGDIDNYPLDRIIKEKNINEFVYLGYKKNPLPYIYAADILLLVSRAEAQPLVILEAMALRTLVISSDVGGIPDMIIDKNTGYLFDHRKPEKLIDILNKAYFEKEENKRIIENAFKYYYKNFSNEVQAEKVKEMLNNICES